MKFVLSFLFILMTATLAEARVDLVASTTFVSFGDVYLGSTRYASITIYNWGDEAAQSITVNDSGDFSFYTTDTCWGSLQPNGSCRISVEFRPNYEGYKSGSVRVYDNKFSDSVNISLSGKGIKHK
jgi:hypothetical protein